MTWNAAPSHANMKMLAVNTERSFYFFSSETKRLRHRYRNNLLVIGAEIFGMMDLSKAYFEVVERHKGCNVRSG